MRKFLIFVGLMAALGLGTLGYLLHVADTMAPPAETQEVEIDVTLPR